MTIDATKIKYILVGSDSYMCMMVDPGIDMLEDGNCIDVPFNSQSVTALCGLIKEYDIQVLDFMADGT